MKNIMNEFQSSDQYNLNPYYRSCRLCPRDCGVDRTVRTGFCGCTAGIKAARAGLHYYEEPFLSGNRGSGTVFFSGCSLQCIYCQNYQISGSANRCSEPDCAENRSAAQARGPAGFEISTDRLARIFLEQQERGAHNLNLVTGTHYTPSIAKALEQAKNEGLSIPVIWNSSGYEKPETLQLLQGLADIFLPDFKTLSPALAERYMKAPDYPERAKKALACMVQMAGAPVFEEPDQSPEAGSMNGNRAPGDSVPGNCGPGDCPPEDGYSEEPLYEGEGVLLKRGVVVRHLVIPGQTEDSKAVLKYLHDTYGDRIWISLMSQYTPVGIFARNLYSGDYPELCRKVTPEEYDEVVDYAIRIGIEQCMIQEGDTASDSFIPAFDGEGIL